MNEAERRHEFYRLFMKDQGITVDSTYGNEWSGIRSRARKRDGNACRECGATGRLHVHHIHPVSQGGTHLDDNLVTLCVDCHRRQHEAISHFIGSAG